MARAPKITPAAKAPVAEASADAAGATAAPLAEPGAILGQAIEQDTSGPARGAAVSVTDEPSGEAVAAADPAEAPTAEASVASATGEVVSRDDGATLPGDAPETQGFAEVGEALAMTVVCRADRHRMGRAWRAGDSATFSPAELADLNLTMAQWELLEADPAFEVRYHAPAAA